jgi:hypothetical protein
MKAETSSERLPSCSDPHFFRSTRSAFSASCLVRIEAWRTVSPLSPSRALVRALRDFLRARYGIGFSIPYRGCVRPTSATYCLSNRQPAFSVLDSCFGLHHSREEEPDVSRRPSSLRPDRRFSMGFVAPGLTSLHVSRKRNTFRSWPLTPLSPLRVSRAVLSDDLRDSRRGLGCDPRHPVKGADDGTTRDAFLR